MLDEERLGQRARPGPETDLKGRVGPRLAPHQRPVDPAQRAAVERHHRKRQDVLGHAGRLAQEDLAGGETAGFGQPRALSDLPGDQRDRGRLDDVAVLDLAPPADRGRIGRDLVGRPLHRPQPEDEQARASAERLARLQVQPQHRVQPANLAQVQQRDLAPRLDHHQLAGRRDPVAGLDHQARPAGIRAGRDLEPLGHAGPRGAGEVGLALADIVLVAGQVGAGQEPAVEPARTAAQAVEHQRPLAQRVLDRAAVHQVGVVGAGQPRDLARLGGLDQGAGSGLRQVRHGASSFTARSGPMRRAPPPASAPAGR